MSFKKYHIFLFVIISLLSTSCQTIEEECNEVGPHDVQIIAHRGYWKSEGAAQNSIFSLKSAGRLGIYGTEFDVWKTKDDKLVVCHDRQYYGKLIADTTFDELRNDSYKLSNRELIPSLEDFFFAAKEFPNLKLVLELKSTGETSYNKKAVDLVFDTIKEFAMQDRVDFISFSLEACQMCAQKNFVGNIEFLGTYFSVKDLFQLGVNGIDYPYSVLLHNPDLIKHAHCLGMTVNAWTVDNEEDAIRLKEMGVDMITTNEPVKLKDIFQLPE